MRYSRPHSNTGFNDLWPAMDFSLMFEHSQIGVKVQKIKHGTGNFQIMKPQIGSFSIVEGGYKLSLAATRPKRQPPHQRMAGAKRANTGKQGPFSSPSSINDAAPRQLQTLSATQAPNL